MIPDPGEDMGGMMGGATREEMIKQAKAQVAEMIATMTMKTTLKADGTFTVTGSFMDEEDMDVSGTWEAQGEKITLTTLMEGGEKKEEPDVISGTVKDGVIRMKPDPEMPFELVLRKQ